MEMIKISKSTKQRKKEILPSVDLICSEKNEGPSGLLTHEIDACFRKDPVARNFFIGTYPSDMVLKP